MPSPYRALFAAPGSRAFSAAGFLGRMPLSMMGIGVVIVAFRAVRLERRERVADKAVTRHRRD